MGILLPVGQFWGNLSRNVLGVTRLSGEGAGSFVVPAWCGKQGMKSCEVSVHRKGIFLKKCVHVGGGGWVGYETPHLYCPWDNL